MNPILIFLFSVWVGLVAFASVDESHQGLLGFLVGSGIGWVLGTALHWCVDLWKVWRNREGV